MSKLKRPLTKNYHLSLTGKEPVLNSFNLYNYFPMGLMIISKMDFTSSRSKNSSVYEKINDNKDTDLEFKIKFINQQASELFEIKENDSNSKIHEQFQKFKKYEKIQTIEKTLDSILFNDNIEKEFYGSFKSQASLIFVKFKNINDDLYICTDYYTDERKIMQNQLFQSLKFQYIATLFHELYNPMNALLIMTDINSNEDESKDELTRSNLGNANLLSEIDETHGSLLTENELEKINLNFQDNEINKKNKKIEELYKNKFLDLKEKEKDINLLVNMINIFLDNLILYLRINLGVNFNQNENQQKENVLTQNKDNIEEGKNPKNLEDKSKKSNKSNDEEQNKNTNLKNSIYEDNYLTIINKNKKLNLEFSFYKHLKKFSYLFKYKGIQFSNDFSYLSDKYIITDDSLFSDFLGQIYSFLYYVVPKSQGFELSYSLLNDNKIKINFQKANFTNKGGYRFKKNRKNNSSILCEDKFNATSTVKTPEMTQEILYKLSESLGIKLKITEYEDQKEDIYLTIIMPYFIDKDNILLGGDINEFPEKDSGEIPYLTEVVERNILNSNNNDNDIIKLNKVNNNKKTNNENNNNIMTNSETKTSNNNSNINKNNNSTKNVNANNLTLNFYKISPERKASFLVEQVDERNSSEEDVSSDSENGEKIKEKNGKNDNNKEKESNNNESIKSNNKNNQITNNKKSNNNNINTTNLSQSKPLLSNESIPFSKKNSKKKPISNPVPMNEQNLKNNQNKFKELSNQYLNEIKPNLTQNENNTSKDNISKDNSCIKSNNNKNILTLIHEKYSRIDKLKDGGVEILMENKNIFDKNSKEFPYLNSFNTNEFNTSLKSKNSISLEPDTENYIEIENDYNFGNEENKIKKEENNVNQNINIINKSNNNILLNLSTMNNSIYPNSPIHDKIRNKIHISKKSSNKTLTYNNTTNDTIPLISEVNTKIKESNNNTIISTNCNCDCKDILLVDDDEFILKTSKNILKSFKLQADFAENGQECLNKIKEKQEKNCNCSKNKYKLVLMDITMPIMDGIEAAKNIQKMIDEHQLYDSIKIIFISAHVNLDLSSIMSGIKCAIDYYAKPISGVKYKALLDKYYYSK